MFEMEEATQDVRVFDFFFFFLLNIKHTNS